MSRQDKITTERNTKTLRELVKRPENKVCADCKRNDPRWASWNLGVFLCIRCSGIHRGMGTHISKVKSVDLDVWTPEQMESIQSWGNYLANLYWEAHLKPGHIPPDHKMESFIRSKYESRRWAMEGPPPSDPSTLENGSAAPAPAPPAQVPAAPSTSRPVHAPSNSLSARNLAAPFVQAPVVNRQPQPHQLLSTTLSNQQSRTARATATPPPPPSQPKAPEDDLFTLDFHAPARPPGNHYNTNDGNLSTQPKKDVKQDILSLFSTPAAAPAPAVVPFGQFAQQPSPWGNQFGSAPQQPTSMMGSNGTGAWGVSSGWNAPVPVAPPAQGNLWGDPTPQRHQALQANLFDNTNVWGTPAAGASAGAGVDLFGSSFATAPSVPKKDDVFGDLWGGSK